MYAKPHFRALDASVAAASCTPCDPRTAGQFEVYVSIDYTQVYGLGFCSPVQTGTGPLLAIDIGNAVGAIGAVADRAPPGAIAIHLP